MNPSTELYWRRKLSAYMHDSPDKVTDLVSHEIRALDLSRADQFYPDERFNHQADWDAAAADRLPFPYPSELVVNHNGVDEYFRHPLNGEQYNYKFSTTFKSIQQAEETSQVTKPTLLTCSSDDSAIDARNTFIARWRLWRNWAADRDSRFAFLPADTRIPDHTIWNHLAVTTAFQGCMDGGITGGGDRPAMLLFAIGPVQDFISAARSTRDLWSGSYLLSYLVAKALAYITLHLGPDHVIFPNLCGQPLIDLLLKKDVWEQIKTSESGPLWNSLGYDTASDERTGERTFTESGKRQLLTPSLSNRFLVLVPESKAAELAKALENEVRTTLKAIAGSVAEKVGKICFINQNRFDQQTEAILDIYWNILPLPESLDETNQFADTQPKDDTIKDWRAMLDVAASQDPRLRAQHPFRSYGTSWAVAYKTTAWLHDGVKQLRTFHGWAESSGWTHGRDCNKDALNGKEEAVLTVPHSEKDAEAEDLSRRITNGLLGYLRGGESLGTSTLIKRFWNLAWLCPQHGFDPGDFAMPNVHSIAMGKPFDQDAGTGADGDSGYFAVLALDGDEIGKWVSGANTPKLRHQLANKARRHYEAIVNDPMASPALKQSVEAFLDSHRILNPSFHLQFSELLGNFSLVCARRIVEAFDGRLIYAGGDDVLALLPASTVFDCAQALRSAFRGESDKLAQIKGAWLPGDERIAARKLADCSLFTTSPDALGNNRQGFIRLHPDVRKHFLATDSEPLTRDVMLPVSPADVSVGIAIAHIKSPLQDIVRAAQEAEKTAKRSYKRGAVAVTVYKRSGETLEWGAKWDAQQEKGPHSLGFLRHLQHFLTPDEAATTLLSNRFPYRMSELLVPYQVKTDNDSDTDKRSDSAFLDQAEAIIRVELKSVLLRQYAGPASEKSRFIDDTLQSFDTYWMGLDASTYKPQQKIEHFLGLLAVLAWINKH